VPVNNLIYNLVLRDGALVDGVDLSFLNFITFIGVIAALVQILAYLAMRLSLPRLAQDIPAGKVASATFLAAVSLSVGLINAACMTY
jgi:Na+-transporting NADH:ubiquinone oxidoreductase subunit NqrE